MLFYVGDFLKSNRFWIFVFAALLLIAGLSSVIILNGKTQGVIANIYQDGTCVHSVDLSRVTESYTILISGAVANTISVEPDRICVLNATCPDQVCVHQGYISSSVVPIVCLPNALVIQIENTSGTDVDAITQ